MVTKSHEPPSNQCWLLRLSFLGFHGLENMKAKSFTFLGGAQKTGKTVQLHFQGF